MTRVRPSLISSVNSPTTDTSAGVRSCASRRRASDHTDVSTRTFTRVSTYVRACNCRPHRVDHSEERDDVLLLSALDVLIERSRNCLLLRTVMSQFPGFLNKPVVDGKVLILASGSHWIVGIVKP